MNEYDFLTFEHSLIFNFECLNVQRPHNNWLDNIFLTLHYYMATVLWLNTR